MEGMVVVVLVLGGRGGDAGKTESVTESQRDKN